jgi:general secretion pathway protein J
MTLLSISKPMSREVRWYGRHADGFTLLELIVAIAIFAVLSVFGYQGLRNFLAARAALEAHNEAFLHMAKGFDLIEQDIEAAVMRPVRDSLGDPLPSLDGVRAQAGTLLSLTRHTAWAPFEEKTSDLRRIEYYLDGNTLLRRTWAVLDRVQDSTFSEQIALTEIALIEVQYLDEEEWTDVWPKARDPGSLQQLPSAIRLRVEFVNGLAVERLFLIAGAG